MWGSISLDPPCQDVDYSEGTHNPTICRVRGNCPEQMNNGEIMERGNVSFTTRQSESKWRRICR